MPFVENQKGSQSNTVSDSAVENMFKGIGVGNECKVQYVSAADNMKSYFIVGVLKSYDMTTKTFKVARDEGEEVIDMNLVTSLSGLTVLDHVKRKRPARQERMRRLSLVVDGLTKALMANDKEALEFPAFKEFSMLTLDDVKNFQALDYWRRDMILMRYESYEIYGKAAPIVLDSVLVESYRRMLDGAV